MDTGKRGGKINSRAGPGIRRTPRARVPIAALGYRQSLSEPMLTAPEELRLVDAWQQHGDVSARDRLVSSHMRLCYSVAARYDGNEEHIRDLAQEGAFGLMKAADKFDPKAGTRFATYARWWVQTSVSQAISKVAAVVDMPPRTYLEARGGGIDNEALTWAARQAARGEVPLDAPVGTDGEATVGDMLQCNRPDPEAEVIADDRVAKFKRAVADGMADAMTAREAEVLRRRALSEFPETLEAIAADFGVSRERIRQIEKLSIDKLRRHLINNGFPRSLLR